MKANRPVATRSRRAGPAPSPPARRNAPPKPERLGSVRTILLDNRNAPRIDARQLFADFFMKLRLDVKNPHRQVGRQLVELAADQGRCHVLGELGEGAEAIREGALEDDRADAAQV